MIDKQFKLIEDRIFTNDPTLFKLVQKLKNQPAEEETDNDKDNKDKKVLQRD